MQQRRISTFKYFLPAHTIYGYNKNIFLGRLWKRAKTKGNKATKKQGKFHKKYLQKTIAMQTHYIPNIKKRLC